MDITSIAAASIQMSSASLQQQVDIAVTKKAMDSQEAQMMSLINQMLPAQPSFGHLLDTYA